MKRIAGFERIAYEQFAADCRDKTELKDECGLTDIYNGIRLPLRATSGSAGYDFFIPFDMSLSPGKTAVIPTGIRVRIEEGWFLMCCPKSGLGTKYRLRLDNTVGIIDSDYYYAKNGGHIIMQITNSSEEKTLELRRSASFAQGIFMPYGITADDCADSLRIGGFGSTSKI
ncbi:MAG: deoxyuridine 5'-triphosphate nucleotidohydrolase [Ruminococcus sp.]|nr:deoxyuridine 5'-triphosphate nucleotidohydrolase [Ruminococcus sp.]